MTSSLINQTRISIVVCLTVQFLSQKKTEQNLVCSPEKESQSMTALNLTLVVLKVAELHSCIAAQRRPTLRIQNLLHVRLTYILRASRNDIYGAMTM